MGINPFVDQHGYTHYGSGGGAGGSANTVMGIAGGGGSGLSNTISAHSLVQVAMPDFGQMIQSSPDTLSLITVLDNFLKLSKMRELGVPTPEAVFANKTSAELIEFFNKNKVNYYIVLNSGTVLTTFEYEFEGVMRVYVDSDDKPYLSIWHKTIDDLIKDQEM